MKPGAMMRLGVFAGLTAIFVDAVLPNPSVVVVAFAAGALFGKGYGVWEARKP